MHRKNTQKFKTCIYEHNLHSNLTKEIVTHMNKFDHNLDVKNATQIKRESNLLKIKHPRECRQRIL